MGQSLRLTRDALARATAHFSALVEAYDKADDGDRAADREATAAVHAVVSTLESFAHTRRAQDEARARAAITSALRRIYTTVCGGDGSDEAPPSRRTLFEGTWQTDDERRAVIARVIERWLPELDAAELKAADLSPAEIDADGGPQPAAAQTVARLFERRGDVPGFRGATVFGLPL